MSGKYARKKTFKKPILPAWIFLPVMVLYNELLVHLWTAETLVPGRLATVTLFALAFGGALGFLASLLPGKAQKWTAVVLSLLVSVISLMEYFLHDAYQNFMPFVTIFAGAGGVMTDYLEMILSLLVRDFWRIVVVLLPILAYVLFTKCTKESWKLRIVLVLVTLVLYVMSFGAVHIIGLDADQLGDIETFCAANGILDDLRKVQAKTEEIQAKRAEAEARKEAAASNPPPQIQVDLIAALDKVEFNPPEKRGARVYDDKKFFTSLKDQLNAGRTLSEKQMSALMKLAARYSGSIPGYAGLASEAGVNAEPAAQTAEPVGAPSDADVLLNELSKVSAWAEPVKRGRRVYDDKDFFDSLMKQKKSGKVLSIKQVEALRKLAAKYGIQA